MADSDAPISNITADGKTILVIEDDPSIMTSITHVLRHNRFKAVTANVWTEALDALAESEPDLILLDLVMPNIDGVKLLQFLRESGSATPVIIVSASIDKAAREVINKLGISAFIAKPFRINVLVREIWRALEPPFYEGQKKYEEGDPVFLDNQHVWQGQPVEASGTRRRRRRRNETPTQRWLRRWRQKYPFINPFVLVIIGGLCWFFAWFISND
ncbi:MAG: CheY-like chemotaxis protein [Candidatus Latescibacterota bacterium]|jgi:CheY-like chemotaxis protein